MNPNVAAILRFWWPYGAMMGAFIVALMGAPIQAAMLFFVGMGWVVMRELDNM